MKLITLLAFCALSAAWIGAKPRVQHDLAPVTKTVGSVARRTSSVRLQPNRTKAVDRKFHRRWDAWDAADDELYYKHLCKGDQLWNAFLTSDAGAAQIFGRQTMRSEWPGDHKAVLEAWGWTEQRSGDFEDYCNMEITWGAGYICEALGISIQRKAEGGENVCWSIEHGSTKVYNDQGQRVSYRDQTYDHGGRQYRKTGGTIKGGVNHRDGVLFGHYLFGVMNQAKTNWMNPNPNPDELPAIRHVADILYGFWFRDNPDIKNLHYYWVQDIINIETVKIAARITNELDNSIVNFPGHIFSVEDDVHGKALLGSPIGVAIGYMLVAHKAELGNKRVSKVQMFIAREVEFDDLVYEDIDLLFHIDDVPE